MTRERRRMQYRLSSAPGHIGEDDHRYCDQCCKKNRAPPASADGRSALPAYAVWLARVESVRLSLAGRRASTGAAVG
jgi:hypothetical protein